MAKRKKPQMPGGQNPMAMMQQLQQLQQELVAAQQALADETVEASAGGGVVKVTLTGDQRCTAVQIAPEVLDEADSEMVQDLLLTAFNSALEKSRELAEERLGPLASNMGGLGL